MSVREYDCACWKMLKHLVFHSTILLFAFYYGPARLCCPDSSLTASQRENAVWVNHSRVVTQLRRTQNKGIVVCVLQCPLLASKVKTPWFRWIEYHSNESSEYCCVSDTRFFKWRNKKYGCHYRRRESLKKQKRQSIKHTNTNARCPLLHFR